MFEFREIKSENEYKLLELNPDAPFTQSWLFGEWQEAIGRKVRRFEIRNNAEIFGFFQPIIYNLVFSNNFIYVPHGPVVTWNMEHGTWNMEFFREFKKQLTEIGKEENAVFVRFDLFPKTEESLSKYFKKIPAYAYRSSYFQPKFEWIINLNKTEDEFFNEMHPKTRYNIRLAEKKGVKIEIVKSDFKKYFEDFYRLLKETAKRDNFNLHPKDYYLNIFKTLNSGNSFLAVAEYEDKILLVNLILLYGKTANFIFGGSSDEFKNLMFSHLAQWESIKEAKKWGINFYNFGGVDPSTSFDSAQDKSPGVNRGGYESYGGISVFKKRFGGEIFEYSDSYDLILKPLLYKFYNFRKWLLNLK